MRKELLKYINCPVCSGSDLEFVESKTENKTIIDGSLICESCRSIFLISKGILYLYEKLSESAEKEKKANETEVKKDNKISDFKNDSWVLNFPNVKKMGIDLRTERIGRLISENIILSFSKYLNVENKTILEIGAGNCWVTARLAEKNYCIALDILTMPPDGLESGNIFLKNKNIYFERISADMSNLPFKDLVFDFVLISASLHHSPDVGKTLAEIYRVLKSGGKLVVLNEPCQGMIGTKERGQAKADLEDGMNEKRYSIREWKTFFKENKFEYEILLPENISRALKSRSGIYKIILRALNIQTVMKVINYLRIFVFLLFDSYFNAVLIKKEPYEN
ncbi:MAG: class I SAM-dependent methyltransferase [Patescibacteria group bacterium]|jgi:SAM-dependent methyltransferase